MIHFPNRWAPAAAAACAVVTLAAPSAAQDRATKLEAKKHYVRGVELYDAEDYLGAAEAFKKAHALLQRPVILFNLGLSYDKLGRPVEAVETLEKVVSAPGKLAKRHVATAKKTLAANAAKVATLLVTSNVAGSTIVVNGREIGKAPLAKPVRVKAGKVLTRSFAAQHMPAYQTVQAAPGQTTTTLTRGCWRQRYSPCRGSELWRT